MKKFLFVLMALVVCSGAFGGSNICGKEMSVSFEGTQKPKDNEFVYFDETSYKSADKYYKKNSVSLTGGVWECDNDHCQQGKEIEAPAGHVFGGITYPVPKRYRCVLGMIDDYWVWVNDGCTFNGEFIDVEKEYPELVSYADCWNTDQQSVLRFSQDMKFRLLCTGPGNLKCVPETECVENASKECVVANAAEAVQICKGGKWGNCKVRKCQSSYHQVGNTCVKDSQEQVSCKDKRTTPEGKACCDVESTVAVWHNNKCECVNGGAFVYGAGIQPYCKVTQSSTTVTEYQCDDAKLAQLRGWMVEYRNNTQIVTMIQNVIEQCDNHTISEGSFTTTYLMIERMIQDLVADQSTQKINDLAGRIDTKIEKLGLDLKKWRNVDGSFNTARLASDSIAGVVLGTVGGVVTSSIIKKNQVADGFEDIKCAIGGQSVASYGDQFSVGLQ
ncbi:MAG: hypothetical protein KBS86_00245 [Proteobacteria bacterium]|nr:hypothetical protein [Candidatus Enterousia scatequi]